MRVNCTTLSCHVSYLGEAIKHQCHAFNIYGRKISQSSVVLSEQQPEETVSGALLFPQTLQH